MLRLYALLCAGCCFLIPVTARAQSPLFSHAIGGGLFTTRNFLGGGIVYSPRLNMIRFSNKSVLSAGMQLGLGTSIGDNYNSNTGGNSTSIFMINVPFLLTWNYGNAATSQAITKWGFFAGAGYGFQNSTRSVEFVDDEEVTTNQVHVSGVALGAGIRFPVSHHSFGISFSYLFNNNHYNPDIHGIAGISVNYNIGAKVRSTR